jgi:hypothetical protein
MSLLRLLGFLIAVTLLMLAVSRFRRRALRLSDALIMGGLAGALGFVAIAPSSVDPLLSELGFPPGDARRVIGVLVVTTLVVLVLLMRAFARADSLEKSLGDYADRVAARWFVKENEPLLSSIRDKVTLVIPALDEEESLPKVLGEVPRVIGDLDVEVIVVSDGSTDDTERVAEEHGALIAGRDLRRGQGATVTLGYRLALLRNPRVIATCDADGQYDPAELPRLVQPIIDGDADVVHGSRALGEYEAPLLGRSQGIKVFAWVTSRLARTTITDPASGFRAFTPEALSRLRFREDQFHASEVTLAAAKLGLRVKEVPINFRERAAGTSKKPPLFRYGYGYTRTLFRTWLG